MEYVIGKNMFGVSSSQGHSICTTLKCTSWKYWDAILNTNAPPELEEPYSLWTIYTQLPRHGLFLACGRTTRTCVCELGFKWAKIQCSKLPRISRVRTILIVSVAVSCSKHSGNVSIENRGFLLALTRLHLDTSLFISLTAWFAHLTFTTDCTRWSRSAEWSTSEYDKINSCEKAQTYPSKRTMAYQQHSSKWSWNRRRALETILDVDAYLFRASCVLECMTLPTATNSCLLQW